MKLEDSSNRFFLRDFLLVQAGLAGWFLFDNIHRRNEIFFGFAGLFFLLLFLTFLEHKRALASKNQDHHQPLPAWLLWLGAALVIALVISFFFFREGLLANRSIRLFLFTALAGGLAWFLNKIGVKRSPYFIFASFMLLGGVFYRVGAYLPQVQPNPFSLGWSEGSRYYSASAFFAETIYGRSIPLSVLDPSRGILQAFPFLLGSNEIGLHRLWLAGLWVGLTAWTACLLVDRFNDKFRFSKFWLFLFFFLFLFQGAVYFHLLPILIIVFIGYSKKKPAITWVSLIIASIWAGLSRINWLPVPGLVLGVLTVLDTAFKKKSIFQYFSLPVFYALVGTGVAYLSKLAYIRLSGENPQLFDSAFSSTLLWYRLLPNATYRMGILIGIILLCLPLLVMLGKWLKVKRQQDIHPYRLAALALVLLVFLVGGVIVSTKIGGGGDLHNLDAFIVFFLLISVSLLTGTYKTEHANHPLRELRVNAFWFLMLVLVPVFFAFQHLVVWNFESSRQAMGELGKLNQALQIVKDNDGKMLFISNRQLQTFHLVPEFELIPEYEKDILMEMAMAKNEPYLKTFDEEIMAGRFTAVLVDQLNYNHQTRKNGFGEENNAWLDYVLLPLADHYVLGYSDSAKDINLLVRKDATALLDALGKLQN